jgi:tRNA pseudouridine synthase 10
VNLKNHLSLCKKCKIRQGFDKGLFQKGASPCFICNDLMDKLDAINNALVAKVKEGYEFKSFQIGVSLPSSYVEREDDVRSRLRVKGRNNIKSQLVKNLREMFKKSLSKELDNLSPDLRINLAINDNNEFFFDIVPTSVILACRYLKKERGIPQKQERQSFARTLPSNKEFQHGTFFSLEELISEYLKRITAGVKVKFSWIGSEDKDSLVLGNGRPFFAEVIKPKRRLIDEHTVNLGEKGIELFVLGTSKNLPQYPLRFVSTTRIYISAERIINRKDLECLASLNGSTIKFKNKSKTVSKAVHKARIGKVNGKDLELEITADSGLHIKQFVGGKEYCEPNISRLLGLRCECLNFDIVDISLPNGYNSEVFSDFHPKVNKQVTK